MFALGRSVAEVGPPMPVLLPFARLIGDTERLPVGPSVLAATVVVRPLRAGAAADDLVGKTAVLDKVPLVLDSGEETTLPMRPEARIGDRGPSAPRPLPTGTVAELAGDAVAAGAGSCPELTVDRRRGASSAWLFKRFKTHSCRESSCTTSFTWSETDEYMWKASSQPVRASKQSFTSFSRTFFTCISGTKYGANVRASSLDTVGMLQSLLVKLCGSRNSLRAPASSASGVVAGTSMRQSKHKHSNKHTAASWS